MTNPTSFPEPADRRTAACERCDATLADYFAGDLDPAARAEVDAHLAGCAACRTLVADLRAITAEAATLPIRRPERDLWGGVAERIAAPVVPLAERAASAAGNVAGEDVRASAPASPGDAPHVRWTARRAADDRRATRGATVSVSRRWLAAAAAALMVGTSGVTYVVTRDRAAVGSLADGTSSRPLPPPHVDAPPAAATAALAAAPEATGASADSAIPDAERERATTARLASDPVVRPVARRPAPAPAADVAVPGAAVYDREIALLRTIVRQRRGDLDSITVAVLERNLGIIDQAIVQSRAALARDPQSRFLGEQLTRTLGQKVELLRTAALLPRT